MKRSDVAASVGSALGLSDPLAPKDASSPAWKPYAPERTEPATADPYHNDVDDQQAEHDDGSPALFFVWVESPSGERVCVDHVSPAESVLSLRQMLLETHAVCYHTSYSLEAAGVVYPDGTEDYYSTPRTLQDYLEISEYPEIQEGSLLHMKPLPYDARQVRIHVRRLREILARPPVPPPVRSDPRRSSRPETQDGGGEADPEAAGAGESERSDRETGGDQQQARNEAEDNDKHKDKDQGRGGEEGGDNNEEEDDSAATDAALFAMMQQAREEMRAAMTRLPSKTTPVPLDLRQFYRPADPSDVAGPATMMRHLEPNSLPSCVESVTFSGWNPPPARRALLGDLAYLEIRTKEGHALPVTATPRGFFVNASRGSHFNPSPARPLCHGLTLVDLLRSASPTFRSNFAALLQRADASAATPDTTALTPWNNLFNLSINVGPSSRAGLMGAAGGLGAAGPVAESMGFAFGRAPWLVEPADSHSYDEDGGSSGNAGAGAPGEPWKSHGYDLNRAEDELLATFGMDERGFLRDWNDEYQACRDLPQSTLQERVLRARSLAKVQVDFVEAATRGAIAVSHGHVPPLNPVDDPMSHVYVFNSIFFSLSMDQHLRRVRLAEKKRHSPSTARAEGQYPQEEQDEEEQGEEGGAVGRKEGGEGELGVSGEEGEFAAGADADSAMLASANHDLQGVMALNRVDLPGVHTTLTALISYRGRRMLAQSIIPGILQGESAGALVYGSVDNGATIACEPAMHEDMRKVAHALHMAERVVVPTSHEDTTKIKMEKNDEEEESGTAAGAGMGHDAVEGRRDESKSLATSNPTSLVGPVEAKGIVGSDGRRYMLDFVRFTPRDANYYDSLRARLLREAGIATEETDSVGEKAAAAVADAKAAAAEEAASLAREVPWWDLSLEREPFFASDLRTRADVDAAVETLETPYCALLRPELLEKFQRVREVRARREHERKIIEKLREMHESAPQDSAKPLSGTQEESGPADDVADAGAGGNVGTPGAGETTGGESEATAGGAVDDAEEHHAGPVDWVSRLKEIGAEMGLDLEGAEDDPELGKLLQTKGPFAPRLECNVNVFTPFARTLPYEQRKEDEETVREIARYLWNNVLPSFATDLVRGVVAPLDGDHLTTLMHAKGINVRYLGRILQLCELAHASRGGQRGEPPAAMELLEMEMVARVARTELHRLLREDPAIEAAPGPAVAVFLNCLLGTPDPDAPAQDPVHRVAASLGISLSADDGGTASGGDGKSSGKQQRKRALKRMYGGSGPSGRSDSSPPLVAEEMGNCVLEESLRAVLRRGLTHATLWSAIESRVLSHFGVRLRRWRRGGHEADRTGGDETENAEARSARRMPLLRRLCQKAGIQVVARSLVLAGSCPVRASDVAGLVPVVKHSVPPEPLEDVTRLQRQGHQQLSRMDLPAAFESVQEALLLIHQVSGAAHRETAACCSTLAMILWNAKDKLAAVAQQQRAVFLMERMHGLDHHETIQAHLNLGLMLASCGDTPGAVKYLRRVLFLTDLVAGPRHSDSVTTYVRMGMIYQDERHLLMAIRCFRAALIRCRHEVTQAGACLHALAVAYSLGGSYREALQHERHCHDLYRKLLGEDDFRTKEAAYWVSRFTERAVRMQRVLQQHQQATTTQEDGSALAQQAGGTREAERAAFASETRPASGASNKRKGKRKGGKKKR